MDRECKDCHKVLPLNSFANAGTLKGIKYYRYRCKPCYSKFKDIRRNGIRKQLANYKKDLKCNRCGFDDYRALQFHHHNDDKEFEVSNMQGFAFESILKEIRKCEVLCANCHFIEHYMEKRGLAQSV